MIKKWLISKQKQLCTLFLSKKWTGIVTRLASNHLRCNFPLHKIWCLNIASSSHHTCNPPGARLCTDDERNQSNETQLNAIHLTTCTVLSSVCPQTIIWICVDTSPTPTQIHPHIRPSSYTWKARTGEHRLLELRVMIEVAYIVADKHEKKKKKNETA